MIYGQRDMGDSNKKRKKRVLRTVGSISVCNCLNRQAGEELR